LPFVWGNLVAGPMDPTFRLGGMKTGKEVSARIQARWRNFAIQGKPLGLDGEPEWRSYQETDRACLLIDRQDTVVNDVDLHIRSAWGDEVLSFR
jgi:para-nitrobenzyl esterase